MVEASLDILDFLDFVRHPKGKTDPDDGAVR